METLTVKKTNGKAAKKPVSPSGRDVASVNSKTSKTIEDIVKSDNAKPNGKENPEVKKVEIPAQSKPELSLEQKIEKIENLKTLIEKREKLEESRKKLTSFVVGANQFSENLVLTDENGNTFKTSNTEVFTKVVETIKNTLISKISEIEQQIEF